MTHRTNVATADKWELVRIVMRQAKDEPEVMQSWAEGYLELIDEEELRAMATDALEIETILEKEN